MKKIIFIVSFLTVFSLPFNFGIPDVKAMTVAEIQVLIQQIQQLQQQIIEFQRQLDQIPPRPPAPTIISISPSSVMPNDTVTVRGRNLRNTTVVAFSQGGVWNRKGSVEGQAVMVLDESSLRFRFSELLDIRPGTYQIYVVNDHGRSNVLNFTVVAPTLPAPIITSVFPSSGIYNDMITIRGRNFRHLFGTIIEFSQSGVLRGTIGRHSVVVLGESSLSFKLSELLMENMGGTGMYQIRVINDSGRSNALNFTVVAPMPVAPIDSTPSITVISPNGGESFKVGDMINYSFEVKNARSRGNTKIYLTDRNTSDWASGRHYYLGGAGEWDPNLPVLDRGAFEVSASWVIGSYYFRAEWANEDGTGAVSDFSDRPFTIASAQPPITVLSLNGGER